MAASRAVSRLPVVVILGATGAGKSKLAIDICRRFNGEIISADSMQVYHGLDIVTNKVTAEERKLCVHHLIGNISPLKESFTIVDFRNAALPLIDKLLNTDKLPVIVGGTNYYIESILWKFLIDHQGHSDLNTVSGGLVSPPDGRESKQENPREGDTCKSDSESWSTCSEMATDIKERVKDVETSKLYEQLEEKDLESAHRIHPRDRRKIVRALEVIEMCGKPMSEILEDQRSEEGSSGLSGPLRYPDVCIIWLQCPQEVLDERIDKRVDKMLEEGLLEELRDFHGQYNEARIKENRSIDYEHGIFQSIGFKEFHEYLLMTEEQQNSEGGKVLLKQCVEEMKRATRKYSRRQKKWIVNRFLRRRGLQMPPIYSVDSTHVEKWDEDVNIPAIEIIDACIKGDVPKKSPLPIEDSGNKHIHQVCDICGIVFRTQIDWEAHLKSRKHRKALNSKQSRERREQEQHRKSKKLKLDDGQTDDQANSHNTDEQSAVETLSGSPEEK